MSHTELLASVESLVDKAGLSRLLSAVSETCQAKAEHVSEAWQDHALAERWAYASGIVDHAVVRIRERAQV